MITAFLLYDDKAGFTTGANYYVGYYESMAPVASMRKLCVLPNALSLGSLCEIHGLAFWWDRYSPRPRIWDSSGRELKVVRASHVPMIVSDCAYGMTSGKTL